MAADPSWLHDALARLAAEAGYPPTPAIAPRVAAALGRRRPAARGQGGWPWPALAAAGIIALAAIAATVLLSRDAREAIAGFLGFGVAGERIEIIQAPSDPAATPLPSIEGVAEETTLAGAEAALGFAIRAPADVPIQRVLLLQLFGLEGVVLQAPGFDIWQFVNDAGVFLGKGVYGAESIQPIRFEGREAYWVTGGPRVLTVRRDDGTSVTGTAVVTSGHALIFSRGEITFRIEGDLALEEALAIARSIP